ncbi:helix-turn-helix domain-containing protein [Gluconobacter oxydans]|uniref:helix-turn-helix domain-containing protein n=1 Tax=Gluconobacter oxydans TaxID=442 RepID=UPI0039E85DEC
MSLKAILIERGITQTQLAAQVQMSEPTVSRWVKGASYIPTHKLREVASVLNVSLDALVPLPLAGPDNAPQHGSVSETAA